MNLTVMTEPASEVTGEAIASNVSLVLGEIADTAAGIGEEQLAAVSRLLGRGNRISVTFFGTSGQDLIGPEQQGGTT